jgi:SAM-dependent methyltransferase
MNDQNRRAYDQIAEDYHEKRTDPSQNAWNEFLEVPTMERLLKPLVRQKRVLDVGCGTGILSDRIYRWGADDVFGVDPSARMIEKAESLRSRVSFTTGSAEQLPYANSTFDVVASSLVMHYIENLALPFGEVARVLKPGGQFVFTMHHPFQEAFRKEGMIGEEQILLQPYFHHDAYYWKLCGVELVSYHHTLEEIFRSLRFAGFAVEELVECKPDRSAKGVFEHYEFTSLYPTFIAIRAMKTV